ncbi:MAG: hypothetical protein HY268_07790 [Deltaproteobacteria bacterium]|nr:hypothetical protein [Deltaproteobacteria bacterium]
MGVMPERIGKGPILRKLNKRYQQIDKHADRLGRLLDPANAAKDVADIGADPDADNVKVLAVGEKTHMKDHWFKPKNTANPDAYWSELYTAPILKQGLITALKEADDRELPLETLWICSGPPSPNDPDDCRFEVFVTWNSRQVTLIIHSPDLPGAAYTDPSSYFEEKMWVVKRINKTLVTDSSLFGPKTGDVELDTLGGHATYKVVKRRPKTGL